MMEARLGCMRARTGLFSSSSSVGLKLDLSLAAASFSASVSTDFNWRQGEAEVHYNYTIPDNTTRIHANKVGTYNNFIVIVK